MNWKTIVILSLSIFLVEASFAQAKKKQKEIVISGYVTDVNEEPLQKVSIIVDGISSDVYTNKKGFYKIKIKPDTKTLTAFAINHGGVEVEYDGHTKINFVLLANLTGSKYVNIDRNKMLDFGYGKVSKKDNTYSMVLIDEKNMDANSYKNVYQMIKYKTGRRFDKPPLWIVDGVAAEGSIVENISPVLVKSITVLRGPETAIYGSRGANGVIVITLKKQ